MHIAVVIPAYNVAPWIGECLASLLGQTHSDWSAVVVDDGSDDATASLADAAGDLRIRVIRQVNGGVSAARNRGIRAVLLDGVETPPDAVLFLDADDWLAQDGLWRLAQTLDAAPWAVAASGGYAQVGAAGAAILVRPPRDGAILERLLVRNLFINGGHLLIRREAVEEAGGFRADLSYGEDWEYWTRLALLGEFVSVPSRDPVLFVRERDGSAYRRMASDPALHQPGVNAIFSNPAIKHRLGRARVRQLRGKADAETAWVAGRELIRQGRIRDGRRWLARSLRQAPSVRRCGLMGLSWLRTGPFRPYRLVI